MLQIVLAMDYVLLWCIQMAWADQPSNQPARLEFQPKNCLEGRRDYKFKRIKTIYNLFSFNDETM